MCHQGRELEKLHPGVVVKTPTIWEGLKVAKVPLVIALGGGLPTDLRPDSRK